MSLAKPLALAGFVAVLVAAAVVVTLLDVWAPLGPLLLVVGGLGYLNLDAAAKRSLGESIVAEKPFTIFMPSLAVGGVLSIGIGLVWLAFVDLLLFAVVLAICIVAIFGWWWKRRAPTSA